jgi:hypothetical protein
MPVFPLGNRPFSSEVHGAIYPRKWYSGHDAPYRKVATIHKTINAGGRILQVVAEYIRSIALLTPSVGKR